MQQQSSHMKIISVRLFRQVTGNRRATAGIKITQRAILRFVAPQGRRDSRINVKFNWHGGGVCDPLRRAKFHVGRRIFGGFRPKKRVAKIANFFASKGEPLARCW